jgi:hypothetical protein
MPLVLVCQERSRRRSAAFCEDTRNTRWPRRRRTRRWPATPDPSAPSPHRGGPNLPTRRGPRLPPRPGSPSSASTCAWRSCCPRRRGHARCGRS